MIPALRAEVRKLFSVRSTYALSLFFFGLLGVISFYAKGYSVEPNDLNSHFLITLLTPVANIISVACAIIGLLLVAHEYRYGTITYTLTASNSRSKVLVAKILTITGFVVVYSTLVAAICLGLAAAGIAAGGHSLPHQDINYLSFFIKTIFLCEAYALVGILIPTLVRNMQASVAILFIVPNTVESLLALVVKHPEKWLPFTALSHVADPAYIPPGSHDASLISPLRGAVTFSIYLVFGWLITWYLFLKRDST